MVHIRYYADEDDFDATYSATMSEVLDAISDIYAEDNKLTEIERNAVRNFIYNCDLEDVMREYYEEEIKEFFKDEAKKEYLDSEYNKKHYNDGWQDHIGG